MRDRAPIFVVGSARSGTTLLYRLLLSSGHFPPYRTEPVVFDLLVPRFGDFRHRFIRPFPWDRRHRLLISALHWQWKVQRGRQSARELGDDYIELRFEDLVLEPQQTLAQMSEFIGLPLDYKRIQSSPLGVVSAPNTSFPAELRSGSFEPVGRWKKQLSTDDVRQLESLIGDTLEELEYPLSCPVRPKTSLRLSA